MSNLYRCVITFSIISVKNRTVKRISSISPVSGYREEKLKPVIAIVTSVNIFIGVQCTITRAIPNTALETEWNMAISGL